MRHAIFVICWLAFSISVRAAEPSPVPKPEVRQSVKQLPQSSQSAQKTFSKRTAVKDSNDRHATVENPAPTPSPPPPKRTATNNVTAVVNPSPIAKKPATSRNVTASQKPTPMPNPRSKVKTSDRKHDAMQRYLRE